MKTGQRQTGGLGEELTNAAIVALIGAFGAALVLRAAGSIAAFLTGSDQPSAGPAAGLAVLLNPADPATALGADGLHPVAYWIVTALLLAGFGAITETFMSGSCRDRGEIELLTQNFYVYCYKR